MITYLLKLLPLLLMEGRCEGGYMMRVPGLDGPIELSSKDAL